MDLNKLIGDVVESYVMPIAMPVVENNLMPDSLLRYGEECFGMFVCVEIMKGGK